jgi:CBS domain containing-hemolysin-like protein
MDAVSGLVISTTSCIFLSLFCSLFEACLYAVPLSLVRTRAEEGRRSWRLMRRLKEDPDRPISGILITNTLANTAGAALAGFFAKVVFASWGAGVFMALLTLAILWFSEIIPKTIGVIYAKPLAPVLAWPIHGLVLFWRPLIYIIELSTGLIKGKGGAGPSITEVELASLARLGASEGELLGDEARLIEQVLALDQVRARDLMTPRTVISSLPDDMPLDEAREKAILSRHSRLPVFRADNPEEIEGLCLLRDIFQASTLKDSARKTVADLTQPIAFVPEGVSAHALLNRFVSSREHIAGVIDEFGAFVGIVTLEDVIECLLGRQIVDEYDEHTDMQRFARDQARSRGLPVEEAPQQPAPDETEDS